MKLTKQKTLRNDKMTIKTLMTKVTQVLKGDFIKGKKTKHSDFKKTVYPLFGLMKKSKEINNHKRKQGIEPYKEMKEYAFKYLNEDNSQLTLAINSAKALTNMHKGYQVKPLPSGDFIATRDGVSAYVRALPYIQSLFTPDADRVSVNDIDELVALKKQFKCSAAVYLSFSTTGLEERFHCKNKDVFGLDGLTLFSLIKDNQFKNFAEYIEQQVAA